MAARRIRLPDEHITGGTPAADSLEGPGPDELSEVVGRLRAAHAADLLIRPPGQLCLVPILQDSKRAVLGGLELLSSRSRHYSP